MTASPDDAAASSSPPRAGGGPAAPSFLGTPGRPDPEESPMPQQPPVHDETVRMRPDGLDAPPAPDSGRPAPVEEQHDDTRPVTRDWLLGAPDPAGDPAPRPEDDEEHEDRSTQAL